MLFLLSYCFYRSLFPSFLCFRSPRFSLSLSLSSSPFLSSCDSLFTTVSSSLQFRFSVPFIPSNFLFNSFKLRFFYSRFSLQILALFLIAIFSPALLPIYISLFHDLLLHLPNSSAAAFSLSRPLHLSLDFTSCNSIFLTSSILVKIVWQYIS